MNYFPIGILVFAKLTGDSLTNVVSCFLTFVVAGIVTMLSEF